MNRGWYPQGILKLESRMIVATEVANLVATELSATEFIVVLFNDIANNKDVINRSFTREVEYS